MPEPSLFKCPQCSADYHVYKLEVDARLEGAIDCLICDQPMPCCEGRYILKYFLVAVQNHLAYARDTHPQASTQCRTGRSFRCRLICNVQPKLTICRVQPRPLGRAVPMRFVRAMRTHEEVFQSEAAFAPIERATTATARDLLGKLNRCHLNTY
jgi:hypothetical protein